MNPANDHDLLIRVDTRLETLTREIQLMRDGTKEQIRNLETGKIDKSTFHDQLTSIQHSQSENKNEIIKMFEEHGKDDNKAFSGFKESLDDHEKRMRRIEYVVWVGFGILIAIQFILQLNK